VKAAKRGSVAALAATFALAAVPAGAQLPEANYDEAKVPAYALPDPLRFADGSPVRGAGDWTGRRRVEVLHLFETHVYGRSPGPPEAMRSTAVETDPRALGGLATRRQVRVLLDGTEAGPAFEILLYVPNAVPHPVPAFLGLNFGGNQTVHPDPAVRLSTAWMREGPGVVDHRATEASRGAAAGSWPVERILDRGYALATVYYGDLEPDHPDGWKDGVRSRIGPGKAGSFAPDDWGAIAAWAWGLSRALDALAKDPDVDGRRVAVIGHSRLGKTALWAGAQDERFAMVVSNDSGEGGAALARRRFGETTEAITTAFPHWFCSRYREYAGREDALPVDQHLLLALVAPRPLYVASASEDLWADPRGEFLAAKAAEPVYRLLGREGLGVEDLPAPDRPVGRTIGYHLRRGGHALTAYDWERYLDFADRHVKATGPAAIPGESARTRRILADAALATLFALIGVLSLAAGLRFRAARVPWVLLGWAMAQHSLNLVAGSGPLRAAAGGPAAAWTWVSTVTGYLIALPWALLVEQVVGPGWRSTIRRTWQVFAAYAGGAILVDIALGRPGAGAGPVRAIVAAGALVGFLNLSLGGLRMARDLRALRVGYLVFMALVVHDYVADLGLLPWRRGTGQLGLLVFVACLVYTIASRTLRAQQQLESIRLELATARRIQESLLPSAPPRLAGAKVAFRHVPAAAVAGDLFEFLDVSPRRAGLLVADVSGHGMGAALIASMVKVAAAAQREHADDPPRVLAGIHSALAGHLPPGQFVTAVYVHLDLARGVLRHASAGHPPALLQRSGDRKAGPLGETGPLIVSLAPPDYPLVQVPIAAGDRVLLYTDGVVEAMDADAAPFGPERLSALVAGAPGDPEALLTEVVDQVAAFAGRRDRRDFEDDLTLIAVAVEGSS
jgi:serine phosphatase RsbU (regulator of sigma subunit)